MNAIPKLDPAALERELQEMWRAAGAESPERPVVRAALANFVMLAGEDPASAAHTVSRVAEVMPCRALVVERAPESPTGAALEARTSMHCRALGGGRQVCCEQVTLRMRPEALEGLPAALLGILLPDLPSILYLPGAADLDGPVLPRLAKHVDRLIVDSAGFTAAAPQLVRLDDWRSRGLDVADLNWSRLDAWRELFASFFDTAPFDRDLGAISRVELEHLPGSPAQALLLAGWLASRLDWRFEGGERDRARFTTGTNRIEVRFVTPESRASARLRRIEAWTTADRRFIVEVDPVHPSLLVAHVENAGIRTSPQRSELQAIDADTELLRILQRPPGNPAHAAALAAAARLAAASGAT